MRGVRGRSRVISAVAALAFALVAVSPAAAESVGEKIDEKCGHGEPIGGGYTQRQYAEALNDMSTATRQYFPTCESEIRNAELAAAGGGGGGVGGGSAAAAASNKALPLSPTERKAVQGAHKHGSGAVEVGSEPIRPGVVKANIASAVNALPHSLFALLALLLAAALTLTGLEVRKRVRTRRHG